MKISDISAAPEIDDLANRLFFRLYQSANMMHKTGTKALDETGITTQQWAILLILNFFFLIIGFFLHSAAAIILVIPIVIPLITAAGIDPVHFGLVVTLNLAIGQQTPPVASVLITACSVARANIWEVSKVNIWFVGVLLAVLMICTYVPAVPMFLVEYFYR